MLIASQIFALAVETKNISLSCMRVGSSRSDFYEVKDAFER